jgi:hypothetical protein
MTSPLQKGVFVAKSDLLAKSGKLTDFAITKNDFESARQDKKK